jgi:hypothetical protein
LAHSASLSSDDGKLPPHNSIKQRCRLRTPSSWQSSN